MTISNIILRALKETIKIIEELKDGFNKCFRRVGRMRKTRNRLLAGVLFSSSVAWAI